MTATILLRPLHVAGVPYVFVRHAARRRVHRLGGGRLPARASSEGRWARSLFLYSIVYLTLLFIALVVDRTVA